MGKFILSQDVFSTAVRRLIPYYEDGHRVVVSVSGGKDSSVGLLVAKIAAEITNRLPVEVFHRDEEIAFPGSIEYMEWIYNQPWTDMYWGYAGQPVLNAFNRDMPYWWVFDDQLEPDQWVRKPPPYAKKMDDLSIKDVCTPIRFPPPEGKKLYNVISLRAQESSNRRLGVFSSGGFTTKMSRSGSYGLRPLYDWEDSDVWRALKVNNFPYNSAYDKMYRYGIFARDLRIAPPTMSLETAKTLQIASRIWPRWFEQVCERLPGVRQGVRFGKAWMQPWRKADETWEDTYWRTCVNEAPDWIAERSTLVAEEIIRRHAEHSKDRFPVGNITCGKCPMSTGNWRNLAMAMFSGDPWLTKLGAGQWDKIIPCLEPEYFRPGSGIWYNPKKWTKFLAQEEKL